MIIGIAWHEETKLFKIINSSGAEVQCGQDTFKSLAQGEEVIEIMGKACQEMPGLKLWLRLSRPLLEKQVEFRREIH